MRAAFILRRLEYKIGTNWIGAIGRWCHEWKSHPYASMYSVWMCVDVCESGCVRVYPIRLSESGDIHRCVEGQIDWCEKWLSGKFVMGCHFIRRPHIDFRQARTFYPHRWKETKKQNWQFNLRNLTVWRAISMTPYIQRYQYIELTCLIC